MPRWRFAALVLLAGCDTAPVVPARSSACTEAAYPAWQTSAYVLPYPPGRAYRVLQGNCGRFSHEAGSASAFAIDFRMPIGEVVTAMRGGTVYKVAESYADANNRRDHANGVVVDHGDGTMGLYLHFTQDGAAVEEGDAVAQGDTLGFSGHTGFSTEPHLHVDVRDGCPGNCRSVPITFRNTSANPRGLLVGRPYLAIAP